MPTSYPTQDGQPDKTFLKWPAMNPIVSTEYIQARRALIEKEYALMDQIERVAAERRALPVGPIMPSYTFLDAGDLSSNASEPTKTTLIDLTKGDGKKTTLILYHMMMEPDSKTACASCSMFIDGLNGVAKHLAQQVNVAVIAKAPPSSIREYAQKRGWKDLRFLSSSENEFNKDMNMEDVEWLGWKGQQPGVSVFKYEEGDDGNGQVRFYYQTTPYFANSGGNDVIRGMDLLTPLWNLLDITPGGRGDWDCGLDYVEKWDSVKF